MDKAARQAGSQFLREDGLLLVAEQVSVEVETLFKWTRSPKMSKSLYLKREAETGA